MGVFIREWKDLEMRLESPVKRVSSSSLGVVVLHDHSQVFEFEFLSKDARCSASEDSR